MDGPSIREMSVTEAGTVRHGIREGPSQRLAALVAQGRWRRERTPISAREAAVRTLFVALAIVLTGCAPAPWATDSEKAAAEHPWLDCVLQAIARLDDGKSDPVSIAYGIEPSCAVLYQKVIQTNLKSLRTDAGLRYGQRLYNDMELQTIAAGILTYRASHASLAAPVATAPFDDGLEAAQRGIEAAQRGDYATALRLWRPLADQGDATAQFFLASSYLLGEGVPEDDAEAATWLRKAADRGYALAQVDLGAMYFYGRGVPQDFVQAYMWLDLGVARYPKWGTEREREQAIEQAIKVRDQAASKMTSAQVDKALMLAREWMPE